MNRFIVSAMACVFVLHFFLCSVMAVPVNIQLKWHHQAQFAGCYAALEKGYYQKYGIEARLLEGGPGHGPETGPGQALLDGSADFAISSPEDLLMRRSLGEKVTAVAAIYRKSAVVFLSPKDSAILTPKDFAGHTIAVDSRQGIPDFRLQFEALVKNMHVDRSGMVIVPYDAEYKGFINGNVEITPAYFTGGLIKLQSKNIAVNIIYPGDYRVRFYSDILLTTQALIDKDPQRVFHVVRATLLGWQSAIANIDETLPAVMAFARIKDQGLQRRMLEAAIPLVHTGENRIGWMKFQEWRHMHGILLDQKIIPEAVTPLNAVFTNAFVEKMYTDLPP